MKFVCMGYFDREKMAALPKAELEAVLARCMPLVEDLYKSGHLVVDAGLEQQATTLRYANGKIVETDGPYVETKELVGNVCIIEARDRTEAVRIASLHPAARMPDGERYGWYMEVRPASGFRDGR